MVFEKSVQIPRGELPDLEFGEMHGKPIITSVGNFREWNEYLFIGDCITGLEHGRVKYKGLNLRELERKLSQTKDSPFRTLTLVEYGVQNGMTEAPRQLPSQKYAIEDDLDDYSKRIFSMERTLDRLERAMALAEARHEESQTKLRVRNARYGNGSNQTQATQKGIDINPPPSEAFQRIIDKRADWEPGKVNVTDLEGFSKCLGKEGEKAKETYNRGKSDQENYIRPLPAMNASGFLGDWRYKKQQMDSGVLPIAECSNFSYDAVAESLLDDEIRAFYHILQGGTMGNLHNIAILIPKDETVPEAKSMDVEETKLPDGSLIVDPWARAMGHPADASLFVPAKNFAYFDQLYPLNVNYNSTREDVDLAVYDFNNDTFLNLFLNEITPLFDPQPDEHLQVVNKGNQPLSEMIKNLLALDEDESVDEFEMQRKDRVVRITTTKGEELTQDEIVSRYVRYLS